jgi:hypothetical protein
MRNYHKTFLLKQEHRSHPVSTKQIKLTIKTFFFFFLKKDGCQHPNSPGA